MGWFAPFLRLCNLELACAFLIWRMPSHGLKPNWKWICQINWLEIDIARGLSRILGQLNFFTVAYAVVLGVCQWLGHRQNRVPNPWGLFGECPIGFLGDSFALAALHRFYCGFCIFCHSEWWLELMAVSRRPKVALNCVGDLAMGLSEDSIWRLLAFGL